MKRTTTPREDDTAAVDRNDDDNQGETPGQQRKQRCSAPERHMLWVCFYSFYTNLFYLVRTQRPTQQRAASAAQRNSGQSSAPKATEGSSNQVNTEECDKF